MNTSKHPDPTDRRAVAHDTVLDWHRAILARAERYPTLLGSIEARRSEMHLYLIGYLKSITAKDDDATIAAVVRGVLEGLDEVAL